MEFSEVLNSARNGNQQHVMKLIDSFSNIAQYHIRKNKLSHLADDLEQEYALVVIKSIQLFEVFQQDHYESWENDDFFEFNCPEAASFSLYLSKAFEATMRRYVRSNDHAVHVSQNASKVLYLVNKSKNADPISIANETGLTEKLVKQIISTFTSVEPTHTYETPDISDELEDEETGMEQYECSLLFQTVLDDLEQWIWLMDDTDVKRVIQTQCLGKKSTEISKEIGRSARSIRNKNYKTLKQMREVLETIGHNREIFLH